MEQEATATGELGSDFAPSKKKTTSFTNENTRESSAEKDKEANQNELELSTLKSHQVFCASQASNYTRMKNTYWGNFWDELMKNGWIRNSEEESYRLRPDSASRTNSRRFFFDKNDTKRYAD